MLVQHRECADLTEALRLVEAAVLERTSYSVRFIEKPLYGLQDAPIPELEPLQQRILQRRAYKKRKLEHCE